MKIQGWGVVRGGGEGAPLTVPGKHAVSSSYSILELILVMYEIGVELQEFMWRALWHGAYYFTAFAKKTTRSGRVQWDAFSI